jgi:hypothetical protein
MAPGEYAVHYSSFEETGIAPYCTVFDGLDAAVAYAREQVAGRPPLGCRIYDHQGFVGAPIREVRGNMYKGDSELTPRFRRWVGSILFFGGGALFVVDWLKDFRLAWPSMLGSRILIPGLVLLCYEIAIGIRARIVRRLAGGGTA